MKDGDGDGKSGGEELFGPKDLKTGLKQQRKKEFTE